MFGGVTLRASSLGFSAHDIVFGALSVTACRQREIFKIRVHLFPLIIRGDLSVNFLGTLTLVTFNQLSYVIHIFFWAVVDGLLELGAFFLVSITW